MAKDKEVIITTKDGIKLKIKAKSMDKIKEIVLDVITDAIFTKSQENLVEFDKVDTGFLLRSGNVERIGNRRKIVYSAPYSADVEFGTDPHIPPFNAIYRWVKRKLGIGNDKEAKQITYAVINKISRVGTAPASYLRNAITYTSNQADYLIRFLQKSR